MRSFHSYRDSAGQWACRAQDFPAISEGGAQIKHMLFLG